MPKSYQLNNSERSCDASVRLRNFQGAGLLRTTAITELHDVLLGGIRGEIELKHEEQS